MSDANPYSSPVAPEQANEPANASAIEPKKSGAWRIVLAWEKLRLVYLAWLALVSLAVFASVGVGPLSDLDPLTWSSLVIGFIGANVCFTAGHIAELLLAALGMPDGPRRWVRGSVFFLGTAFASLLTVLIVAEAATGRLW